MQPDRMTTPILHPFPPIWDDRACVLILGSFPSVASRDTHFYYGHKQNRFWKLMRQFFGEPLATTDEKIACLNRHHIALWDVIFQCEVTGSSDQSIRNVIPNPIVERLNQSRIQAIFANGATAYRMLMRYFGKEIRIPVYSMPSTSPANAAYSLQRLVAEWQKMLWYTSDTERKDIQTDGK